MLLRRMSSIGFTRQRSPSAAAKPPTTLGNNQVWHVDNLLIAKSLLLLPQEGVKMSREQCEAFHSHLLKSTERDWLDFDLCMFELCLFFKLFPPDSLFEEFKWVFWTENDLNARLNKLLLGLNLPSRTKPDFQLNLRMSSPIQHIKAKQVVIAIDYGSTHSGFAYAMTTPPQTMCFPNNDTKQPTCVLLDANLNLVAFGNEAKQWFMRNLAGDILFSKFSPEQEHKAISQDYLYFENQKIQLFDKEQQQHVAMECSPMNDPKRKVPLDLVVSRVLMHLKLEALKLCSGIETSEVLWVLTVPAIWTARDKLFMRQCAFQAGMIDDLQSSNLILALEPECAALAASTEKVNLEKGSKLLTFDCGGGTVDVCLIQVMSEADEKFTCKQLLAPSGGEWGSIQIDMAFITFLDKLMNEPQGGGFYKRISIVNPAVLIELMDQWEKLKCKLTLTDYLDAEQTKSRAKKTLDFTGVMKESLHSVVQLVKQFNSQCPPEHKLTVKQESILTTNAIKIRIPMKLLATMFTPTLDSIVNHCGFLYRNFPEELAGLRQILLVGGLGSNPYLHFKFEKSFPGVHILESHRSSALVEVGAVKFGLQPAVFQSRKSNITLGVKTTVECYEGMAKTALYRENRFYDPATRRYYCRNVFKPFVIAGEDVMQDDKRVVQTFRAASKDSEFCKFDVYTCDGNKPVDYVTEPGCRLMAQLMVPVQRGEMCELELTFKVGLTEISAKVTKKATGEVIVSRVLFDFS